jgi:hypothetical protein
LLEHLLSGGNGTAGNAAGHHHRTSFQREIRDLVLDRVSLSNFGPYGSLSPSNNGKGSTSKKAVVHYPLSKRGLVLIRGKSNDGTGADSNGSGKVRLSLSLYLSLSNVLKLH